MKRAIGRNNLQRRCPRLVSAGAECRAMVGIRWAEVVTVERSARQGCRGVALASCAEPEPERPGMERGECTRAGDPNAQMRPGLATPKRARPGTPQVVGRQQLTNSPQNQRPCPPEDRQWYSRRTHASDF